MKTPWPGQPGGYVPTVAESLIKERGKAGNIVRTPTHVAAKQAAKKAPTPYTAIPKDKRATRTNKA